MKTSNTRVNTIASDSAVSFQSYSRVKKIALLVCFLVQPVILGCSKDGVELATVEGCITLDGIPLDNATVVFYPELGRSSYAYTNAEGHYRLRYARGEYGARIGKHSIRISTQVQEEDRETGRLRILPERVPSRYNVKSDLTADVKAGSQNLDFDLTTE